MKKFNSMKLTEFMEKRKAEQKEFIKEFESPEQFKEFMEYLNKEQEKQIKKIMKTVTNALNAMDILGEGDEIRHEELNGKFPEFTGENEN